MSDLREAAQQALEAKQTPLIDLLERVPQDAKLVVEHDQFSSSSHPVGRLCHEAAAVLRAALAEPVITDDMKSAVRFAPSSAYWSDRLREFFGPEARNGIDVLERRLSKALAAAEPKPAPEPQTCTWFQDGDSDSGVYNTSCGRHFNLEDGTPEDNRMQWCCYCGKKLVQELIVENKDE